MLKGVYKPLFRKSVDEPLNETSIIIQEKMRTEDKVNNDALSNKSVPKVLVKVVPTTETNLDIDKLEQKDNMPKFDLSHKACCVADCMSCAFNVMHVYFNSNHASSDNTAPRQHMNNKKHVKDKNVPSKNLNNVKHAKNNGVSPQHVNKDKNIKSKMASPPKARLMTFVPKPKQKNVKALYKVNGSVYEKVNVVENKTASPPKRRVETFVPRPKQKFVKAGYKLKCSFSDKTDSVNSDNVVLPDKGQFFKYVGTNQV